MKLLHLRTVFVCLDFELLIHDAVSQALFHGIELARSELECFEVLADEDAEGVEGFVVFAHDFWRSGLGCRRSRRFGLARGNEGGGGKDQDRESEDTHGSSVERRKMEADASMDPG